MDSPVSPRFRRPEYAPERENGVGYGEKVAEESEDISARVASSQRDQLHQEIDPAATTSNSPHEAQRLRFTDSAKHGDKATRKLHLHHETSRGPSEARSRRQSSVVINGMEGVPKIPLYIHLRNAVYGSLNMLTSFPYWDMAFYSGWSYTWGSVLFIVSSAWAWVPLQWPDTVFIGQAEYGSPLTFFFGALLYQIGAVMSYFEAINDGSFGGAALKRFLDGKDQEMKTFMDAKLHMFFGHMIPHHHSHDSESKGDEEDFVDPEAGWKTKDKAETPGSIYPPGKAPAPRRGGVDMGSIEQGEFHEYMTWRWWPTWNALITYHIKDMGYIACVIQLFGVTLYAICGVIGLPGILSNFTWRQTLGGYWVLQVVAAVCFLVASILFTLITQEKWHRPLPHRIAWWIGFWATVGSVGFLLSAIFGVMSNDYSWGGYQSSLSSLWGSFFYLVSSWLQWYESVNKGPVLGFPNNRVPVIMRVGSITA
ncbi:hypothetical protein FKW77_007953 [Venturia effusa]|uniref:Integral membrane protein n=1 Tax=Venturia effusa TaxID=50376 RepID=A0A517KWW8_9PEZI|nr:hypothetical protein FKW77_007953 [Venturia effusa]